MDNLSMEAINAHMKEAFDPKRFVIRERFKFWSHMASKTGELIQELATRIRQEAATCDFSSVKSRNELFVDYLSRFQTFIKA